MKSSFIGLLLVAFTFAISCSEEDDECSACQSALNHMADKIKANNCNPSFMQNAWDRIRDDCGNRESHAVGYLAENCTFGYNGSLTCTKLATGLQFFDDRKRPISLRYTNIQASDTLLFILGERENSTTKQSAEVSSNQSTVMQYEGYNEFYAPVYITVLQLPLMDTVATEKGVMRYNRTNNWSERREVHVTYDTGLQGYTIELKKWE